MINNHPELYEAVTLPPPNTPEWLQWRKERALGTAFASQAAAVLGRGKFAPRNRRELYLDKHGLLARAPYARATNHGNRLEPKARAIVETLTGEVFFQETRISECGRFVASPDGVTVDGRVLLEVKCPVSGVDGDLWAHAIVGELPQYYYWQCVQQAALSDCEELLFFVYAGELPHEQKLIRLSGAELRAAWHLTLKPAILEFLDELQQPLPPGETTDPVFLSVAAELAEVDQEYKALEKRREKLVDALKASAKEIGGDSVTGGGYVVSTVARAGAVDYEKLFEAHGMQPADIEPFRKKGTSYLTVRSIKEKAK